MQIQEGGGYAKFRVDFGYQELCTLYYTVRIHTITLDILYLSSRTKPAGNCKGCSRNTDLTTRGQDRGVVTEITRTIHSLVLDFCVHAVYTYTNLFPRLQANWAGNTCPVKVGSEANDVDAQNQDMAVVVGTAVAESIWVNNPRLTFHWACNTFPVGL